MHKTTYWHRKLFLFFKVSPQRLSKTEDQHEVSRLSYHKIWWKFHSRPSNGESKILAIYLNLSNLHYRLQVKICILSDDIYINNILIVLQLHILTYLLIYYSVNPIKNDSTLEISHKMHILLFKILFTVYSQHLYTVVYSIKKILFDCALLLLRTVRETKSTGFL